MLVSDWLPNSLPLQTELPSLKASLETVAKTANRPQKNRGKRLK